MSSNRLDHIRSIMQSKGVDGFLISSSSNIFYLSGFDRFLVDHDGYLFVTKNRAAIITSPLYTQAVKKFTPDLEVLETSPDLWYSQMVKKVAISEKIKVIGFEEKDLRVAEYLDLQEEKIALKSVSLRMLRAQKDEKEIAKIKKACQITDEVFTEILPFVKEGVSELFLSEKMEMIAKEKGAAIGFPSIVAFGPHSAVPHHMTSDERLQKNSFALFDFGIASEKYLSDMSRTVFLGSPTNDQVKLYETVRKSQQTAMEYIESVILGSGATPESEKDPRQARMTKPFPVIFAKEVDRIAREVITKENLPLYPHALGHGVGLEVHEAPTLSLYSPEELIEHMVFTLEPGSYDIAMGGVRIEDVYTIQNQKLVQLTNASKELIVL